MSFGRSSSLKRLPGGAGAIHQWIRSLAPEDPGLIFSTNGSSQRPVAPVPGDSIPSGLCIHRHIKFKKNNNNKKKLCLVVHACNPRNGEPEAIGLPKPSLSFILRSRKHKQLSKTPAAWLRAEAGYQERGDLDLPCSRAHDSGGGGTALKSSTMPL